MLTVALQQTINGVVFGSLYVLVALGLTLIYGVLVQINFAHADVVTIGAFAAYFFTFTLGGNYLVSIAVALVIGAALGWLVNAAIFAPLRGRSELLPLIATIGVSILLQNAMLLAFGPIPYAFDSPYSNAVLRLWGGTFITWQNLIIITVSAGTVALLYAFMKFTFMGKALRAVEPFPGFKGRVRAAVGRAQRGGVCGMCATGLMWRMVPNGDAVSRVRRAISPSGNSLGTSAIALASSRPRSAIHWPVRASDTRTRQLPPSRARRRSATMAPNAMR